MKPIRKLILSSFFRLTTLLFLVFMIGCASQFAVESSPDQKPLQISGVGQTLLALLDKQDKTNITAEDYQSTSLKQLVTFGTPAGYRLKLRYLEFGVALVEALKAERDPEFRKRLIEVVQWSRRPKVRAEAIITLASLYDPSHKKFLKEALLDNNIGIRFAAVEALQSWNQPEPALPLLQLAMGRDGSPLMKIYATQALLALGETNVLNNLWKGLDHNSWIIRAMSARYLGDYGTAEDYHQIVAYLNRETSNSFVKAELCIAALKLISKKGEKVSYSPSSPGWRENEEVSYTIGKGGVVEIEPLVIVPPRLRIPVSLQVAAQVNTILLDLIRNRLDEPLDKLQAQDPIVFELNSMVTPTGFALKTRYSELSYLVIEGLAGTTDPLMRGELQRLATDSNKSLVRATALIALAYNRNQEDLNLIQNGLEDKNANVRMGAMEAIEIGRFRELTPSLLNMANNDPSPALQVYALQVLSRFGDPTGRNLLITHLSDFDWPARAMSYWYLGRFGAEDDYSMILARLPLEENPFVQSEVALACLKLTPLDSTTY